MHLLSLDESINKFFTPISENIMKVVFYDLHPGEAKVPIVVLTLIIGAIYFTIYFKFINFSLFKTAIQVIRGKYDFINHDTTASFNAEIHEKDGDLVDTIKVENNNNGEVSHFQALTSALSATVGLGNIGGVATAITIGGPGATFWMIVAGLLGMASKFIECTLGVKYREIDEKGTVYGGPMYYLKNGLKEKGMAKLGKVLAVIFAVMCIGGSLGGGNMYQANQAVGQFTTIFGIEADYAKTLIGFILAIIVGVVIIGGIKRIAKLSEIIVPFMCGIYVIAAIIIIILKINLIPDAISLIFEMAFNPKAIAGGVVGVIFYGFQRAAFSNEAGQGSASIAHAAVKTKYPASEGLVALLEPFIDTVIICTITALVLVVTNLEYNLVEYGGTAPEGVQLTSNAFNAVIPGFKYVLTIAIILFAFSTMLSWSYYGLQAWTYLFGKSNISKNTFKIIFCIFIVLGSATSLSAVLDFSDAMSLSMVFPNIIGLIILAPKVKEELDRYLNKIKLVKS